MSKDLVDISSGDEGTAEHDLVYEHRRGTVELNLESLECLNTGSHLKDNIIQLYTAYLLHEVCPDTTTSRVHMFDSIFYQKLTKIFGPEIDIQKLKRLNRWLKDIDIFAKDFLVFPVCSNDHWFAIVVCNPWAVPEVGEPKANGASHDKIPGIIVMDSLNVVDRSTTSIVRDFLDFEWRFRPKATTKRFSHQDLKDYFPRLSKQKNPHDCGIYMLSYIESFLKNPDEYFALARQEDMDGHRALKGHVQLDRSQLKDLVLKLCRKIDQTARPS